MDLWWADKLQSSQIQLTFNFNYSTTTYNLSGVK